MADPPVERERAWVAAGEGDAADVGLVAREEWVSVEEPLEIRVESPGRSEPVSVAVTMRTPGHEADLAVGFLFTEGLLRSREDLAKPSVREVLPGVGACNVVTVRLRSPFDPSALTRHFYATSSCGVCGKASIEQVERAVTTIGPGAMLRAEVLRAMPAALRAGQDQFARTGGLHAIGLFSLEGALELLREDVGRHNAMDKVIGRRVLEGRIPLARTAVMASGRVSFELVQKAAMAGVPFVCAVSAPTSLAIRAAERFGVTLVAFVREGRFTVYAHPERIG
jgi:FdhD protein